MKKILTLISIPMLVALLAVPSQAQVERREVGNLVLEDIPDIPTEVVERMLQYTNVRSAYFTGWESGGRGLYVVTRFGETSQIHYLEQPGGARHQITFFNEPVSNAIIRPAGQQAGFLFPKDVGGGEFYQIFYFDLVSGEYTMLTDGRSRNGGVAWSKGGDRFAYYSTARNGRDWDVYVSRVEEPAAARMVLEAEGTYLPVEWSPDDSRLLVQQYVSINESYVYVVDVSSGEITQLNPSEEKIAYYDVAWSRDGRGIYYTSDENSEFQRLRYHDLAGGESTVLTEDIPWDVESIEVSRKGDVIAFITNEDGIDRLHLRKIKGWKALPVPEQPVGLIGGVVFSPDDRQLALTLNTPQTPSDTYTLDIKKRKLTRWTFSEVGGLETEKFAVPELIHYPTFDEVEGERRMIPSFYYKPAGVEPPYPVIISIHGGPEG
ncbi:MAG: DPP IV N-terminal domain-containing protein, partial [Fidelibacterota bacterium]